MNLSSRSVTCIMLALSLPIAARAQAVQVQDGGTREKLVSIFIPPAIHAPLSFVLTTEWTRSMQGGGTFTLANQRRVERDSRGRIYQERWILVPKGGKTSSVMNAIEISDPAEHTRYNCQVQDKTCYIQNYAELAETAYAPTSATLGALPNGMGERTREELGANQMEGVSVTGYRETTTLNPGVYGNDRPMVTTRELWFAPSLGINLMSKLDDAQSGKQVFTVKELSLSEPDLSVFTPPEGYKIVDERESGPN